MSRSPDTVVTQYQIMIGYLAIFMTEILKFKVELERTKEPAVPSFRGIFGGSRMSFFACI